MGRSTKSFGAAHSEFCLVLLTKCSCKTPDATRFTGGGGRGMIGGVHAPFLCATDIHGRRCAQKQQERKWGKCSTARAVGILLVLLADTRGEKGRQQSERQPIPHGRYRESVSCASDWAPTSSERVPLASARA